MLLPLTFGSSLGWTAFDFARKKLGSDFSAILVVVLIMATQGCLAMTLGGLERVVARDGRWWLYAMASIGLNAVANVFFVLSVNRAPYTLVIPLLSLSPALAALIGFFGFSEILTPWQILGVAVIVLAALALGLRGEKRFPNRTEFVGLGLMLAVACMWATTPFFDKLCTSEDQISIGAYLAIQCFGIALVLLPFLFFERRRLPDAKRRLQSVQPWLWVALAALGSTLGLWLQIQAISTNPVGLFEAGKRSMNLILALIAGRVLLRETISKEKILAAAAMALGIALLQ